MTNGEPTDEPDPFDEGSQAAAQGISAEANPYPPGSDKYALWQDGYELGAQTDDEGKTEES